MYALVHIKGTVISQFYYVESLSTWQLRMSSLLHIEFHELYWSIFISNPFITKAPDFNVISCQGRQLYIEPRWWVEGATGASRTTPLSIPQGITVWIENTCTIVIYYYAQLAQVVTTHKQRSIVSTIAPSRTCWGRLHVSSQLIHCMVVGGVLLTHKANLELHYPPDFSPLSLFLKMASPCKTWPG